MVFYSLNGEIRQYKVYVRQWRKDTLTVAPKPAIKKASIAAVKPSSNLTNSAKPDSNAAKSLPDIEKKASTSLFANLNIQ